MRRRFLLVNNTSAGRSRTERVNAVVTELTSRGCDVQTLSDRDLSALDNADALSEYDAVVGAGGDGTIRRLIASQAGQVVPLGFIPNGTGNVLACEIGLKPQPTRIADVLIAGPEQVIQTGRFEAGIFFLMVGYGFDANVIHNLNIGLKKWTGKLAFAPAVARALVMRPETCRLLIDGEEHKATWAIISNARHYGGSFMLAPQAALTKRSFEIVLFKSHSRWTRVRQLWALALGRVHTAPETKIMTGRQIDLIDPPKNLLAQADGDPVEMCPRHIKSGRSTRLIVPNRYLR